MPGAKHLIEQAFDQPYLMNEILAFSARHLASTRPDMAPHYIFLAREYQAHALSFFNTTHVETTADNCLQMLVFSWMVGMNLLELSDGAQTEALQTFSTPVEMHVDEDPST
ncbi:hypothetical protein ACHAQH_003991 [Verticillium albo-atrum]